MSADEQGVEETQRSPEDRAMTIFTLGAMASRVETLRQAREILPEDSNLGYVMTYAGNLLESALEANRVKSAAEDARWALQWVIENERDDEIVEALKLVMGALNGEDPYA